MADDNKYYYMRLKDGFFEEDAIKIIEAMPDGYLYSNILLKLYLKSLKFSGKLMYNERIPYNATVLATITGHQVGTIEKAIKVFQELDLIEVLDNGAIYMLDIQSLIGKSSTEADRKREYRAKITAEKQQLLGIGQMSGQFSPEIELKKDIDIDIEKEKKPQAKKEEKKKAAPYVADDDLNSAIIAFIDYRKKIKKPMTDRAIQLLLNKLNELSSNVKEQIAILNQSILNGWQTVYPLKDSNYQNGKPIRQEVVPAWMQQSNSAKRDYNFNDLEKSLMHIHSNDSDFEERKAELEKRLKEKYGKPKEESKSCQT